VRLCHYSTRGMPGLAGYRAALSGTHPATDGVRSGCLMVGEPKVCHGRFWRVVRARSMVTGDVRILGIWALAGVACCRSARGWTRGRQMSDRRPALLCRPV
jgi:hypothetical protein